MHGAHVHSYPLVYNLYTHAECEHLLVLEAYTRKTYMMAKCLAHGVTLICAEKMYE